MIGIVSQARMTSTRLPGKVLKQVNSKTLLDYHIERLQQSGFPVYIATTTNHQDDVIIDFCETRKIPYFRGSEHDVLSRYAGLVEKHKLNQIVRVTSDCPLIDGNLIQEAFTKNKSNFKWNSYICNTQKRTYPRGFDFEIFSAEAIRYVQKNATLEYEREHVTPYIWKSHPELFEMTHITRTQDASRFRMTVDEPDDFTLIETLIQRFHADKLSADQIIEIFEKHPDVANINSHVEQKKV